MTRIQAHQRGKADRRRGVSWASCPYKEIAMVEAWDAGWTGKPFMPANSGGKNPPTNAAVRRMADFYRPAESSEEEPPETEFTSMSGQHRNILRAVKR